MQYEIYALSVNGRFLKPFASSDLPLIKTLEQCLEQMKEIDASSIEDVSLYLLGYCDPVKGLTPKKERLFDFYIPDVLEIATAEDENEADAIIAQWVEEYNDEEKWMEEQLEHGE